MKNILSSIFLLIFSLGWLNIFGVEYTWWYVIAMFK